jgi:hypothetical protein
MADNTKIVCHHYGFYSHETDHGINKSNACNVDGSSCVKLYANQSIGCHHNKKKDNNGNEYYFAFGGKDCDCTNVNGETVKIIEHT